MHSSHQRALPLAYTHGDMGILQNTLGLTEKQEKDVNRSVGRVKSVLEYASDLSTALKTKELSAALQSVAPW